MKLLRKIARVIILPLIFTSCADMFQEKIGMTTTTTSTSLADLLIENKPVTELQAPSQLFVSQGDSASTIRVSWTSVDYAQSYRLERAISTTKDSSGKIVCLCYNQRAFSYYYYFRDVTESKDLPKLFQSEEKVILEMEINNLEKDGEYLIKEEVVNRFKLVKDSFLSIKQKSFLKGLLRKENDKLQAQLEQQLDDINKEIKDILARMRGEK